ncbi:hypothetical protein HDR58_04235 [bacterium]|nr:hypothetical protein [bacterium]
MKVLFKPNFTNQQIKFCATKISYDGDNKIVETFNNNNQLTSRSIYDKLERHIHTDWFDKSGTKNGFMNIEYTQDGYIETCKTPTQEYTRTIKKFIKDSYIHQTEEYLSKTSPKSNYLNESIKNLSGKLVELISNGKTILKK